jgi:hypothetical protein
MATQEQINRYLHSVGLKPITDLPAAPPDPTDAQIQNQQLTVTPEGDPSTFGSDQLGQIQPEKTESVSAQPRWKWSWNPQEGLLIWSVDQKYGQPHHIEITGPDFYKQAQGRVYVDPDNFTEILVWADRGPDEWQDEAVNDVEDFLAKNLGKYADTINWQSEGGYYQTLEDADPDRDRMIATYFQIDWKRTPKRKKALLRKQYDEIIRRHNPAMVQNLAQEPQEPETHDLEAEWMQAMNRDASTIACPACNGEGADLRGMLCNACKGTGLLP